MILDATLGRGVGDTDINDSYPEMINCEVLGGGRVDGRFWRGVYNDVILMVNAREVLVQIQSCRVH